MGWNDHVDLELTNSPKELISAGFFFAGGTPFDVAHKAAAGGVESLSDAEADVFERETIPALHALEAAKAERVDRSRKDGPDS